MLRGEVLGGDVLDERSGGRCGEGMHFASSDSEMSSNATVSRVSSSGKVTERRLELQELLADDLELECGLSSGVVSEAPSEAMTSSCLLVDGILRRI